MDGDTCRLPYPQFRINDTVYQTDTVDFEIEQGTVEEWVLVNPSGGTHPFHVHVNAFQVKERAESSSKCTTINVLSMGVYGGEVNLFGCQEAEFFTGSCIEVFGDGVEFGL